MHFTNSGVLSVACTQPARAPFDFVASNIIPALAKKAGQSSIPLGPQEWPREVEPRHTGYKDVVSALCTRGEVPLVTSALRVVLIAMMKAIGCLRRSCFNLDGGQFYKLVSSVADDSLDIRCSIIIAHKLYRELSQ